MNWSELCSWAAFPFTLRLRLALMQLLLIHAIQILLSLKPISLSYIYMYKVNHKSQRDSVWQAWLFIYFAIFVMMEFQFSRLLIVTENIYMGAQADKYSGSGKLKVWLKSKLYQLTTPQDLIYVVHCSKVYLFLSWSQYLLSATLPCVFKDKLVARNNKLSLHERNKQHEQRNP